jgi:ABC-type spermidine/putrescine transport system permease subunit I
MRPIAGARCSSRRADPGVGGGARPTFIAVVDSFQNGGKWTFGNYAEFFLNAPYPQVLVNTLAIALIVTVISLAAAAPVSAFLARQRRAWRDLHSASLRRRSGFPSW